ncbi:MAG: DUF3795 domain-containing protein [Phycisphaerae bacterium]|jgi:hypothetical protein
MDEKQNRRAFLKNTIAAGTGFAIGCSFLSGCATCRGKKDKSAPAAGAGRDYSNLAYCCLDCSACGLFIATRDNNEKLKAEVAQKWKVNQDKNFKLEDFRCFGCKSENPGYFCRDCTVKKCAIQKNLPTCAHCDNLSSCDQKLWKDFPWIKEKAEKLKTELSS